MSTYLYDEALENKIKYWTEDTNIHIYGPNQTRRLFMTVANETNDNPIELPLIAISRAGGFNILNTSKQPLAYTAVTTQANLEKGMKLNAIPIDINYQIDVYARYYKEADEIARNLIFNFIRYPKISITVPYYEQNIEHHSKITLSSEVQDNSDIPERLVAGQFTRLTFAINIDDAYLWDIRVGETVRITDVNIALRNKGETKDDVIEKVNLEN